MPPVDLPLDIDTPLTVRDDMTKIEVDTKPVVNLVKDPSGPRVICCGLSTVDIQLHSCAVPITLEHVTEFSHTTTTAGGSSTQTALALAALDVPVSTLTSLGADTYADTLCSQLETAGVDTSAVVRDENSATALAILPLFTDGRRACFVTLGSNLVVSRSKLLASAHEQFHISDHLRVFHFGYPHLMPTLQGQSLRVLFDSVRTFAPNAIITLDLNGVDQSEELKPVLLPALLVVGVVHANLEEACIISGHANPKDVDRLSLVQIEAVVRWFVQNGAGVATITCGRRGVFTATCKDPDRASTLRLSRGLLLNNFFHIKAFAVSEGIEVNASGAGDAFIAGVIAQLVADDGGVSGLHDLVESGLASALRKIDNTLISDIAHIFEVVQIARTRCRIQ